LSLPDSLRVLESDVIACERCQRLRRHCVEIGEIKRRAYRDQTYWTKPVPSFGDPQARLLIVGLAPGAHGANRTGRLFTGDRSGEFLYRALHETGFASQAESVARGDGLRLRDCWITAAVRCAPPDNKPEPGEFERCRPYLVRELGLLDRVRVVVCLGKLAFDTYLSVLKSRGLIESRSAFRFEHGAVHSLEPVLISSYHPSQQNTSTGRLTREMLREVFATARQLLTEQPAAPSRNRPGPPILLP
jgi:uracil-DNA glycosylase family 4